MKKLSILLVEDDAMIGAVLAEMLADLGYETGAIQATEEGTVAAAERHRPAPMPSLCVITCSHRGFI